MGGCFLPPGVRVQTFTDDELGWKLIVQWKALEKVGQLETGKGKSFMWMWTVEFKVLHANILRQVRDAEVKHLPVTRCGFASLFTPSPSALLWFPIHDSLSESHKNFLTVNARLTDRLDRALYNRIRLHKAHCKWRPEIVCRYLVAKFSPISAPFVILKTLLSLFLSFFDCSSLSITNWFSGTWSDFLVEFFQFSFCSWCAKFSFLSVVSRITWRLRVLCNWSARENAISLVINWITEKQF